MPGNFSRQKARSRLRVKEERQAPLLSDLRDLAWAGRHVEVVARVGAELAALAGDPAATAALLLARAESLLATTEVERAHADVDAMRALADEDMPSAARAEVLLSLSTLQLRTGAVADALKAAERAVDFAAASGGDAHLHARATLALARSELSNGQIEAALAGARRVARRLSTLGDSVGRRQALWVQALANSMLGRRQDSLSVARDVLALARRQGDRACEAGALMLLQRGQLDLGVRLRALKQALQAYGDAGDLEGEASAGNNLALTYRSLGLFRRSCRMAERAMAIYQRMGEHAAVCNLHLIVANSELQLGHGEVARAHHRAAMALLPRVKDVRDFNLLPRLQGFEGTAHLLQGDFASAVPHLKRALRIMDGDVKPTGYQLVALSQLAEAHLALGRPRAALSCSSKAARLHDSMGATSLLPGDPPAMIWLQHYRALQVNGKQAQAAAALTRGHRLLLGAVKSLADIGLRRAVLGKLREHRQLLQCWFDQAREAGWPKARMSVHLRGATDLREPFDRLADAGLRMNAMRGSEDLLEFLVDEAAELSGAERVVVILDGPAGRRIAGSQLPAGEGPEPLLEAIAPWLDEARRTRTVSLRHGPQGADALNQRSCLVAPLVAGQDLLGLLYADIEGRYGCFDDSDRNLLAMLAAQAAVALANLRTQEGLEQQVAERTVAAERRAAELAVINGIQRSISEQLDFQAIVTAVGDKLREVFGIEDIVIAWRDEAAGVRHLLYCCEHGEHLRPPPVPDTLDRPIDQAMLQRRPVVVRDSAMADALGLHHVDGTGLSLSSVFVPMFVSDRLIGTIVLENCDREDAFGEAEE